MATLHLTNTERLLLANQYEILGILKRDDSYTQMASNLRDGYKWLYQQHATQIEDDLSDEDAEHVLAILDIYTDLRHSYNQLSDKSEIDKEALVFPGFDGNNETELLGFAEALAKNGTYSDTIGKPAKNSHMPTTEMYKRQIEQWKALGSPRAPLSKAQILSIIAARKHPS